MLRTYLHLKDDNEGGCADHMLSLKEAEVMAFSLMRSMNKLEWPGGRGQPEVAKSNFLA